MHRRHRASARSRSGQAAFDGAFESDRDLLTFVKPTPAPPRAGARRQPGREGRRPRRSYNEQRPQTSTSSWPIFYVLLALAVIVSPVRDRQHARALDLRAHARAGHAARGRHERRQVRRMVRHESIITALIGAGLGIAAGLGLAAVVTSAFADEGLSFAVPAGSLVALRHGRDRRPGVLAAVAARAAGGADRRARRARVRVARALTVGKAAPCAAFPTSARPGGRHHRRRAGYRADPDGAASVPEYRGKFRREQAERLLWRAGFGPRPGQAAKLARDGPRRGRALADAPALAQRCAGPRRRRSTAARSRPRDAWGHDRLWWLDRMVRTEPPLVERMTLVWHDWFATSNARVGRHALMLAPERAVPPPRARRLPRPAARAITRDPAMLCGSRDRQHARTRRTRTTGAS